MLAAVLVAEGLHRLVRLPRASGHMLVGALASPIALDLFASTDLDPWKPLIDLAIGVLVFELGSRVQPRWLLDNPWLALSSVLEGLLAGLAVTLALIFLGAPGLSAALVGAVAMSSSPVITMAVTNEARPRGQVTDRLLLMAALNSVLAMLAIKAWRIVAVAEDSGFRQELLSAAGDWLYVILGSLLLGAVFGVALERLSRFVRGPAATPVLQIALVIAATSLAAQWRLSPLLALLVAGMLARTRMGHRLAVEPHLGSAGAALTVLMFITLGALFTLHGITAVWPWVLAIIGARLLGKGLAVFALARPSGLGWRQALGLSLALQPMSSLAVLLATSTFGIGIELPGLDEPVLQALLIATTLMQLTGPVWTQSSLRHIAREAHEPQ
jgi:Kef-type K+ transport system membrane component KefB